VQRILKEHGIKSVQGLADQTSAVTFGAVEEAIGLSLQEPDEGETPIVDAAEDEDYETEEKEIDYRFVDTDEDGILLPFTRGKAGPSEADRERLERVLQDLVACRQLLDSALKDG
jgi:hypothetical protein